MRSSSELDFLIWLMRSDSDIGSWYSSSMYGCSERFFRASSSLSVLTPRCFFFISSIFQFFGRCPACRRLSAHRITTSQASSFDDRHAIAQRVDLIVFVVSNEERNGQKQNDHKCVEASGALAHME